MPKKGSLKAPSKPQESFDGKVQQGKPTGAKKQPVVNEIDEIFAGKKRKVQSQGKSDGVNQNESSVTKKKKPVNEIDLIFAGKKRKTQSQEKVDGTIPDESKKTELTDKKGMKKRSVEEQERRFADRPGNGRRKTADGLTIYTEEELGLGKSEGGGSSLCPFDCDCCF
ncbi:unnamed protein product [Linum tenue]|uniref:DUF1764-domain-containing protein n=1 Tax=Linum tenue TaxID=586396 RepID=A0AAV0M898_9ROSI|nr:unnamed protein product [Linum tenue]